jgi:hypothetical protein
VLGVAQLGDLECGVSCSDEGHGGGDRVGRKMGESRERSDRDNRDSGGDDIDDFAGIRMAPQRHIHCVCF